ncbi:hypothetical protein DRQ09_07295 [candidate division KSB1 bacterium]|nr:MAG: hypothetical protein DRQ09_07295 [candidate division KSB1 bacterium]
MGRSLILLICGFLSIFAYLRVNLSKVSEASIDNYLFHYKKIISKNISNSALNFAIQKLSRNRELRTTLNHISFSGGFFDVFFKERPEIGDDVLEIKAVSNYYNLIDSSIAVVRIRNISDRFSRYSYFSNTEPMIYFATGDTLYGPVHTNGQFHFTGVPVFYGLVSSVSPVYSTAGFTDPEFYGGTDFGRNAIKLPIDLSSLISAAQDGGFAVSGSELWLSFKSDGTFDYKIGSYGEWNNSSLSEINGVIYSDKNIHIRGIVSGKVTICSMKDIIIEDDIVYADNPLDNPESEDLLGIVAKRNVIVKDNPQNRIKCEIDGSIMAVDGSFRAENIYFTPPGRLSLLGGIIQKTRGPVGTTLPSGYKKYYKYDDRLEYIFPPYYPIADGSLEGLPAKVKIEIISWWE